MSGDAALPADEFRAYEHGGDVDSPAARGAASPLRAPASSLAGARAEAPRRSAPADATRPRTATTELRAESDASLLLRARAGDRIAFGLLVERHHRSLAAILRSRCGPDVPMEDLLQEVFARTLAHVGTFRGGSSFLTWATSIGLHLATDWRRTVERRRRLAPTVDVDDAEPACPRSEPAPAGAERRDAADRARRALDSLPEEMRIAVTLRIVEDEPYETIAARMCVPLPRVRQWVCRGLRKLRATLEDRHEGA